MKKFINLLFLLGVILSLSGCCPCCKDCKDCAKKTETQESKSDEIGEEKIDNDSEDSTSP